MSKLEIDVFLKGGECCMKNLQTVAFALVVLGALNWGLVGLFNVNLVTMVSGFMPGVEKVVYVLIGLSAVYVGVNHKWTGK